MLTKEDCRQRAPRDGDLIYNILSMLINNLPRVDDGQNSYLLIYLLIVYLMLGELAHRCL